MRDIFLTLSLVVMAVPTFGQGTRTVSVEGRSVSQVEPDTASTELGVLLRGPDLAAVKEETNRRIAAVMKTLKLLGLDDEALRTSQIDLSVKLPRGSKTQLGPQFELYRQVSVEVDDLSLLGTILEKAIDAGSNQISGVRYSTSKEPDLKEKLLSEAIEKAKAQAERLAKGFGAKLGRVVSIQSDRGGSAAKLSLIISSTADPFDGGEYRPGPIEIERSVSVVFELVD
ncbi:MAG: SIMPL domain-containing protein [Planctomycetota bacterium]